MHVYVRLYCDKSKLYSCIFCALYYLKYGSTETKEALVNNGD